MALISLGSISCSPGVARLSVAERAMAMDRHKEGNWGEVQYSQQQANNEAVRTGRGVVYSSHRIASGRSILVQTDLGISTFMELEEEKYSSGNTFKFWKKTHQW